MQVDVGWCSIRCLLRSPQPTHAIDVTDTFEARVESLACHQLYLGNLDGDMASPNAVLRGPATATGAALGFDLAASFEIIG